MGCHGCGIGSLLDVKTKKGKKQDVVNNYYINDDHSVEITDSILHRTNVADHMRICPYCGRKLDVPGDANFCPYCEKRLRK